MQEVMSAGGAPQHDEVDVVVVAIVAAYFIWMFWELSILDTFFTKHKHTCTFPSSSLLP